MIPDLDLPKIESKNYTVIRLLIVLGLIALANFIYWFVSNQPVGYSSLFWMLGIAFGFRILRILHEWYHLLHLSVPKTNTSTSNLTADVFTTYCKGEPKEMLKDTLLAIKNIHYPHVSYLCDESNDAELKSFCDLHEIHHISRKDKKDAKAGNINNALKYSKGEICLVLDPDHKPKPEFLDRVMPYFNQKEIGFVQVPQAYHNQNETWIAKAAAEQTYMFYGPLMLGMNQLGTAQSIGANCTFRRSALESIGGHAAGLAEDMHTAMQLHAKGWKSIYHPEILSRGLVPSSLSAYYKQQLKWSRGIFELLFSVYPKLFLKFNWQQKIHYLTISLYFLFGMLAVLELLVPMMSLIVQEAAWKVDFVELALYGSPVLVFGMGIRLYSQKWLMDKSEKGLHLNGGALRVATWWIYALGFLLSIIRVKVPYIPTSKINEYKNVYLLNFPNALLILFSALSILYAFTLYLNLNNVFMMSFALFQISLLGAVILSSQQASIKYFEKIWKDFFNLFNRKIETEKKNN